MGEVEVLALWLCILNVFALGFGAFWLRRLSDALKRMERIGERQAEGLRWLAQAHAELKEWLPARFADQENLIRRRTDE